jgi:hypothetical protein
MSGKLEGERRQSWENEWHDHMIDAIQAMSEAQKITPGGTQTEDTARSLLELTDCMDAFTTVPFKKRAHGMTSDSSEETTLPAHKNRS